MDWSDVAEFIGSAAPMIGGLLAGPAGAAAGRLVASALGVEATPDAVAEAIKQNPKAITKLTELEYEHQETLRRMTLTAETRRLTQINQTMRAEITAENWFKTSWRPAFGYMAALTWGAQIGGTAYAVVASPEQASEIIQAVTALTPMWSVALAVLGVSIHQRSRDKQIAAGQAPTGLLQSLFNKQLGVRP